jgi:hypothetical protein
LALGGVLLLSLYPLKGLLPALFAQDILGSPNQAAWLAGLFGLGGVVGSLLYARLSHLSTTSGWLRWSAAGVLVMAALWVPKTFFPMAAGYLLFSVSNVMARLSIASTLQSQIPLRAEGAVMGVARFSGNLMSVVLRLLVGAAFAVSSPAHAFLVIGVGLAVCAMAQLWLSVRIGSSPSTVGGVA